jgi:Bacterial Ig-like domain (group 3)/Galactose oxidase, central domain
MKFRSFIMCMFLTALPSLLIHAQSSSTPNWIQLAPAGAPPSPRSSPAAVLDSANDRLIVFGGQEADGNDLNDLWILANADGLGGAPQWINVIPNGAPGSPPVRWGASAVYDQTTNRMIIFAGCNGGCLPTLNDVWVLTNANGIGGTPNWVQLSPTGGPPAGRTRQAAVYDSANNRMIVFAGQNGSGFGCSTFSDVWVLTSANGIGGDPAWNQLSPVGGPPSGQYAPSAIFNSSSNTMTVFGGGGFVNGACTQSNATWVLKNANNLSGPPTWVNVIPENSPGAPPPRGFHTSTYDPSANRMIVFGGNNDAGVLADTWILSNADGSSATPVWQQLSPTGGTPPRTGHVAGFNTVSGRMTVFGGHSGTCCLNDDWVLSNINAIAEASTSTTVTSSSNPSVFGQIVTLTATVTPSFGSGAPTGSVTFVDGSTTLGTASLTPSSPITSTTISDDFNRPDGTVDNGWSTWNGTSLASGTLETHGSSGIAGGIFREFPVQLPVTFSFDFSTASTGDQCHVPPDPANDGGWLIALNAPDGAFPPYSGAQLQFFQYSGSRPVNRQYLSSAGLVSDSISSSLPDFGPTPIHITGTINADLSAKITVGNAVFSFPPTAAPLAASPGGVLVLSNANCSPGPDFFDNFSLSNQTLGAGQAALTVSNLPVGLHSITAIYSGDSNFAGSTSPALVQTVNKASTVTALTSSPNPSIFNRLVTFTANVNVMSPGAGVPTGTLNFMDGSITLATVPLSFSGQVAFTTSALAVNSHTISAVYSGDANFNGSSGSLSQGVSNGICVLYDQTRSVKSGATFPIKLQLCDANGSDVSSSAVVLHATQVTSVSGFSGPPTFPGDANPDADFRFDTTLGPTGGYIFNLRTSGLASGTYSLTFTATGDPVVHTVNFGVN